MTPWFELDPERYAAEEHFWLEHGFSARRDGDNLVFHGTVGIKVKKGPGEPWEKHDFELTVTYLPGFPYVAPEVTFIAPPIRHFRHQSPAGKPCLFPDEAWHSDRPADEFFGAIEAWLRAYITGTFPRELALYELPQYLEPSRLEILGPPGLGAVDSGLDAGRFRLTELLGLDLAIVTHIQDVDVGTSVLEALSARRAIKQQERAGEWYRLRHEPAPPRTPEELKAVLAASGHSQVNLPPKESPRLLALVFDDDAFHEERWLFLDYGVEARRPGQRRKDNKPRPRPVRRVRAARFYSVSHRELFRRLEGVRDTNLLSERIVTVFGLGAVGSHTTITLADEGVGEFILCDPDTLQPGNVVRHALDLSDVGQPKPVAMAAAVRRNNPYAETSFRVSRLRDPEVMEAMMSYSHLVISAVGDDNVEEQLNEVAVKSPSTPTVLYVRTLHAGDALRIFRCRPGRPASCAWSCTEMTAIPTGSSSPAATFRQSATKGALRHRRSVRG